MNRNEEKKRVTWYEFGSISKKELDVPGYHIVLMGLVNVFLDVTRDYRIEPKEERAHHKKFTTIFYDYKGERQNIEVIVPPTYLSLENVDAINEDNLKGTITTLATSEHPKSEREVEPLISLEDAKTFLNMMQVVVDNGVNGISDNY